MATPCDLIAGKARRAMQDLDRMVTKVQRMQNTVGNIFNSVSDQVGQAANSIPDPNDLTPVSDINNMLGNIAQACPQLNVEDVTGFATELQESYQGLLRSAKKDPLLSLKSLQDNLRSQFSSQGITDKLSNLQGWLECIEAICGTLDGFAPGKGNTASEISNYYNSNLSINNEGEPQILSDNVQSQVSNVENKIGGINSYIEDLSTIGI